MRFPHYADRCVTVYNGADIDELSDRSGRPGKQGHGKRFIFVGRVSPEKGIHVLLEAFKTVLAREPEAELRMVGGAGLPPLSFVVNSDPTLQSLRRFYTSDYMEYLQRQAKAVPENHVSFVGYVAHSELATFLRGADVFVQPSVRASLFPCPSWRLWRRSCRWSPREPGGCQRAWSMERLAFWSSLTTLRLLQMRCSD